MITHFKKRGIKMIFWDFFRNIDVQKMVDMQNEHLEQKRMGDPRQYILFAEHMPCLTYNSASDLNDHRIDSAEFAELVKKTRMPIHRFSRGGGITYHGPGQLTVYLIVSHKEIGIDSPKEFMHRTIKPIQRILKRNFSIDTYTLPELFDKGKYQSFIQEKLLLLGIAEEKDIASHHASGLWVVDGYEQRIKKLVSRGMRKNKRTNHITDVYITFGFGLNLFTELAWFNDIIKPCGLDIEMTSVAKETGIPDLDMIDIAEDIMKEIGEEFMEGIAHYSMKETLDAA